MNPHDQDHTIEVAWLAVVAVGVISVVGVGAITAGMTASLVQAGVLVGAVENPMVALPGAGGAGLDGGRLLLIGGVLVMVISVLAAARQTAQRNRRS